MTFALTKVKAYGVEASEPLQKRFLQRLELDITGANTNVAYDFGTYAGTFWTAVGSTEPGLTALKAIKNINLYAKAFLWAGGLGLTGRTQLGTGGGGVTYIDSAAYGGGSATPTLTVTGLAAADTILAATQRIKNQNSLPLLGWTDGSRTADQCVVAYSADPGTTGVVRFSVIKAASVTAVAGQYTLALDGTNTKIPNITFVTADAPTTAYICLEWEMTDAGIIVEASASA